MQHSESLLQLNHTTIPLSPARSMWQIREHFYRFLYIFNHWWLKKIKAMLLNKWKQLWCTKHHKISVLWPSDAMWLTLPNVLQITDKLNVTSGGSQWGITPTRSRVELLPFTKAHLRESATSAKRGEIQKIYKQWEVLRLQPSNHLSTHTPPRQAVGWKHGNCSWSRKELLTCFLELSHDWDSCRIRTRVFASLHKRDLKSVTEISFQAKKAV